MRLLLISVMVFVGGCVETGMEWKGEHEVKVVEEERAMREKAKDRVAFRECLDILTGVGSVDMCDKTSPLSLKKHLASLPSCYGCVPAGLTWGGGYGGYTPIWQGQGYPMPVDPIYPYTAPPPAPLEPIHMGHVGPW